MTTKKSKPLSGELVPRERSAVTPTGSGAELPTRVTTDWPVKLWWTRLLAQSEARRWNAFDLAVRARTGAYEALKGYERAIGDLDDIDRTLDTDRMEREGRRQEAALVLDSLKRRRMEEEIAIEETKRKLDRLKRQPDTSDEDDELRQLEIATQKLALLKQKSALQRDIDRIEDGKPEKRLHADAQRFDDIVAREDQILTSLKKRILEIVERAGGEKNLTKDDKKRIHHFEDMAKSILST